MNSVTEEKLNYSSWQFIKDIVSFLKPYKSRFFAASFLRFSSDLVNLYPSWAIAQIILLLTDFNQVNRGERILMHIVLWIFCYTYHLLAHHSAKIIGIKMAVNVGLDARIKALKHIFKLDLAWQEKENTGNKLKKINNGQHGLEKIIRMYLIIVIESTINTVGIVFIFFRLEKRIAVGLIFFMICYYLLSLFLTKKAARQTNLVSRKEEDLEGLTFEALNNIKTVKALSIYQKVNLLLQGMTDKVRQEVSRQITFFQGREALLDAVYLTFELVVSIYLIINIFQGDFNISFLFLFRSYFWRLGESVSELSELTHEFVISKIWVGRMMGLLQEKPTVEVGDGQENYPQGWQELHLKNISFSYGGNPILEDLNLTIKRGERIGIVGVSGAGKSTLFKLLMDLYEDYRGDINFDGLSLRQISRESYIDHTAVVLQDTELFNASLRENIYLAGREGQADDETELQQAVHNAELDDLIARLPQGVDTVIGEKGVKLSGGEKQRLGIARALYRRPDILLLDEATSHLDINSERKIQNSLHKFFDKVTAIVIAHRLSTIREMDRIIVISEGKIAEQGSFEELMQKEGVFARMWKEQKL